MTQERLHQNSWRIAGRAVAILLACVLFHPLLSGKDAAGKDAAGKDAAGKEAAGKETAGKETAGKETAGKETAGKETAGETELNVELQNASMAQLVGAIKKVKAKFGVEALPDDQAQLEMLIFGALSADFPNRSSYSVQNFQDQEELRSAVYENLTKEQKKYHIRLHAHTEVALADLLPELAPASAAGGKSARCLLIFMSCALPGKDNVQSPPPLEILLYAGGRGAAQ